MALIVAPEPPLEPWLAALDEQISRSTQFFADRPVVVNLAAVQDEAAASAAFLDMLAGQLAERGLNIIGVEGVDRARLQGTRWAQAWLLGATSRDRLVLVPDDPPPADAPAPVAEPDPPAQTHLIVDRPVRSGQSIIFEAGDVTVLASVASGAEIIAGGSIHIYGALRGRAVAGVQGNPAARIFCRRLFAELLAIDGLYRTAEHWGEGLHGRPAQAWLEGESVRLAALE
jgi:septum site-determining protein MinC